MRRRAPASDLPSYRQNVGGVVVDRRQEAVYNNMPLRGLAKAAELIPAEGKLAYAAGRLDRESQGTPPED